MARAAVPHFQAQAALSVKKCTCSICERVYTEHMSSPRTRDFYKKLGESIRAERALLDEQHEKAEAEVRALEGRLHRLQLWEEICKQIERLQLWERHATRDSRSV